MKSLSEFNYEDWIKAVVVVYTIVLFTRALIGDFKKQKQNKE
jgi:hypothetical protein